MITADERRARQRERYHENKERFALRYQEKKELLDEQNRVGKLRRLYGLTPEQYDEMLAAQGGGCAICLSDVPGGRKRYFSVDHDHSTGAVRGLLCSSCNLGIGNLGDDAERVRAALAYLETAP